MHNQDPYKFRVTRIHSTMAAYGYGPTLESADKEAKRQSKKNLCGKLVLSVSEEYKDGRYQEI